MDFYGAAGDLAAGAESWCCRAEREVARERGTKYTDVKARPPRRYSDAELDRFCRLCEAEEIRGPTPRYWENVAVGKILPTIAKGPMTVTGVIGYAQGWGGLYICADKLAFRQTRNHHALGIRNRFGIPSCPARVHWDGDLARLVGAPDAHDFGRERCAWLTHHLTNWVGDAGFLLRAQCKPRWHNPEGDLLLFDGTVTGKRVEDGRYVVEASQQARNQDDEVPVVGGTIELPLRGS